MSAVDSAVLAHLDGRGIRCCLTGAAALAARGYARFTSDVDVLTVDASVLAAEFWTGFVPAPERRRGAASDPLVGVVRWDELRTAIIVGRGHASGFAVDTAEVLPGLDVRVPTALALVLVKLEAGGMKDRFDIIELVRVQRLLGQTRWIAEIPAHLPQLSTEARALWITLEPMLPR